MIGIFIFLFVMWLLMLLGGAIVVLVLGPLSIPAHVMLDPALVSLVKAAAAISLVVVWVAVLLKVKDWMFRRNIKH